MRRALPLMCAPGLVLWGACTGKPTGDDSSPGGDSHADSQDTDTGTDAPVAPCTSGTFGNLPDPLLAWHVAVDGDDTALGTWDAPLATLDAALLRSREAGAVKTLFVGPGAFDSALNLATAVEDGTDDGLAIYGCASAETTLTAGAGRDPVVKVSGVKNLVLDGLGLTGGRRALWIWQDATVTLTDVAVIGSAREGVVSDGSETIVSANGLQVSGTTAEASTGGTDIGYGIAVHLGTLELTDSRITESTGVGVLVEFGTLLMDGVTVESTSQDSSGYFGRGVQLQEYSSATLVDVFLANNFDAGFFSLRSLDVSLQRVTVSGTQASGIPLAAVETGTGDGLVFTQGEKNYDVATFQVAVDENIVSSSTRAGMVVDGVTVTSCVGNLVNGNGYPADGSPQIIVQGGAVMPDPKVSDDWTTLASPIPVNALTLEIDDLTE